MLKYVLLVLFIMQPVFATPEAIKATGFIVKGGAYTSDLIEYKCQVIAPVGYALVFPKAIKSEDLQFIECLILPAKKSGPGHLFHEASYYFNSPFAGTFDLTPPAVSVSGPSSAFIVHLPSQQVLVKSRLNPKNEVVIAICPKLEESSPIQTLILILLIIVFPTLLFILYTRSFEVPFVRQGYCPSAFEELLAKHQLEPSTLRQLLLEALSISADSSCDHELGPQLVESSLTKEQQDILLALLEDLTLLSFSKEGLLSPSIIERARSCFKVINKGSN